MLSCVFTEFVRWLGLTYSGPECGPECADDWTWTDGSDLSWSNWRDGEPDRVNRCAVVNHNERWYNHPCNDVLLLKFTCKRGTYIVLLIFLSIVACWK